MFRSASEVCDFISVVLCCSDDNTVAVTSDSANGSWCPVIRSPSEKWRSAVRKYISEEFQLKDIKEKFLRLYRISVPRKSNNWIYHVVFKFAINAETKKKISTISKSRTPVHWISEQELTQQRIYEVLRSPEVADFVSLARGKALENPRKAPLGLTNIEQHWSDFVELLPLATLVEITDNIPDASKSPVMEKLLESAGFTPKVQKDIYGAFLFYCLPCIFMNKLTFAKFMVGLGWEKTCCIDLHRAADLHNFMFLSYRDLMFLLSAIEPDVSNQGTTGEIRARYIFRYYAKNSDAKMSYTEFRSLVADYLKAKRVGTDEKSVDKECSTLLRMMGSEGTKELTLTAFLNAQVKLKLVTQILLRSPKSVISFLSNQSKVLEYSSSQTNQPVLSSSPANRSSGQANTVVARPAGGGDTSRSYRMGYHAIRLRAPGSHWLSERIWQLEGAVSESCNISQKSVSASSTDEFTPDPAAMGLLCGLSFFTSVVTPKEAAAKGGKPKPSFDWGKLDSAGLGNILMTVCSKVKKLLLKEPRLQRITSPVYVLGDLHGNYHDFVDVEKLLWGVTPMINPSKILFLGDYVDRGAYGMEVVSHIFAYKLQNPKKVFLIRGNHEIREVQKLFTFEKECQNKFGNEMGSKVWEAINDVFDHLPIAAIIDDTIFCCHGGIPPPWLCPKVGAINAIACPLKKPETDSPLAWNIMWNDPIEPGKMTDAIRNEMKGNSGFAANGRRGTGHIFSCEALEKFLEGNGLSYVLRAHELAQNGFQVQQNGKLLTVFSTSQYCGTSNSAAVALVADGRFRMIVITGRT